MELESRVGQGFKIEFWFFACICKEEGGGFFLLLHDLLSFYD